MSQDRETERQEQAAENAIRAFKRGRAFVEEVVRENERLRYRELHLQQELARAQRERTQGDDDVQGENERLRRQLAEIKDRFDALNRQNQDFRERYEEVEQQNENLLNLYVSAFQLHSTLEEESVLGIVREILLNLVGAEVFAVWLVDGGTGRMTLAALTDECGLLRAATPALPAEARGALRAGDTWHAPARTPREPLACVPLRLEERTVGVIAIHKLLVQKSGFTALDQELLGMLASQAAAALVGASAVTRCGGTLGWSADDDGTSAAA